MFENPMGNLLLLLVMVLWILPLKGYALWTAVKNNDKGWFVALVILNTIGILELIYIFGFAKKNFSDLKRTAKRILSSKE